MSYQHECPVCGHKRSMPMTNADRIRAMSDEELAYWVMCPYDDPPCGGEPDGTVFNCMDCTLKWLKQPAEVSGDD